MKPGPRDAFAADETGYPEEEPYTGEFRDGEAIPSTPPYRVERKLGRGGHATTYAVTNAIGKAFALKVLHPHLAQRSDHVDRLVTEATRLAKLDHPNIVEVYSAGVTGGLRPQAFIQMQLLSGKSLRSLPRRNNRLSPAVVVDLLVQICSALEAAHGEGIIHQDLKLENVVAHRDAHSKDYVMKLLDFGVSRFISDAAPEGMFEGTPEYAAPEQLSGEELITPKVDLYALGVMAFELVTGQRPYHDAEQRDKEQARVDASVGRQHDMFATYLISDKLRKDAPRLSDVLEDAGIPQRLEDLVASLLARRPANRPDSATEVLKTLYALASTLKTNVTTQEALEKRIREHTGSPPAHAEARLRSRSIRVEIPQKPAHTAELPHVAGIGPTGTVEMAPIRRGERNGTLEMAPVGLDGRHTVRMSPVGPHPRSTAPPTDAPPVVAAKTPPGEDAPRRPAAAPGSSSGGRAAAFAAVEAPLEDTPIVAPPEGRASVEAPVSTRWVDATGPRQALASPQPVRPPPQPVAVEEHHIDALLHSYPHPDDAAQRAVAPSTPNDAAPSKPREPVRLVAALGVPVAARPTAPRTALALTAQEHHTAGEAPADAAAPIELPRGRLASVAAWPLWKLTLFFTVTLGLAMAGLLLVGQWMDKGSAPLAPSAETVSPAVGATLSPARPAEVTPPSAVVEAALPAVLPEVEAKQIPPTPPRTAAAPQDAADANRTARGPAKGPGEGKATSAPKAAPKRATTPSAVADDDKLFQLVMDPSARVDAGPRGQGSGL